VLAILLIPDLRTGRRHRMDIAGVVLASLALLAICYGLVEGQRYNWSTIVSFVSIPLVLGVGVALLVAFLLVQRAKQAGEALIPFALFRSRNFALMNWVSATVTIGMMGIFLPLTIFLQSVLGFSALKAGLALAPASLVSMFVAPAAGRLSDRIGGKFILMTGLLLFAFGMGWLALIARPAVTWYDFLPALAVAGVGIGCTFAPMTTIAMREVQYQLAGAASGVLNTTRQVGSVIGTAAVGALLQNRLAVSLTSQARLRTAGLPPSAQQHIISGFQAASRNGAGIGAGQGGRISLPAGLPASLVPQVERITHAIFANGYVSAMRGTLVMPLAVLLVGAFSCLLVQRKTVAPAGGQPLAAAAAPGRPPAAAGDGLTGGNGQVPADTQDQPDGQVPAVSTAAPVPPAGPGGAADS
jgi:MFS family permease